MRMRIANGIESVQVRASQWALPKHLVYISAIGHLTPAEARRVAAALVKEAERAEKKEGKR